MSEVKKIGVVCIVILFLGLAITPVISGDIISQSIGNLDENITTTEEDQLVYVKHSIYPGDGRVREIIKQVSICDAERLHELICKLEQMIALYTLYKLDSKIEYQMKSIIEQLSHDLLILGLLPEDDDLDRVMDYVLEDTSKYQFESPDEQSVQRRNDRLLMYFNCMIILVGLEGFPRLRLRRILDFRDRIYLKHFKPGCLIASKDLSRNDILIGNIWMFGFGFKGLSLSIGLPRNYIDITIGKTAFIMAMKL